jgi:hypothetical protein
MDWQRLLSDFIIGGGLIALVVAIVQLLGPFMGGIVASMPIRVGITMFLGGLFEGSGFVIGMLSGSIAGSVGAFAFMIVLSRMTRKLGTIKSISLATLMCLIVVYFGLIIL